MTTAVFSVITLLGGLAFFLYGMRLMSNGLKKVAGGKLELILRRATSTPLKGLVLGAVITIAVQSSSAVTVMLVGLVNSGILQLAQAIGVIMGSNIGTTLTAWLLSLSGIQSDNFFLQLLKPSTFAPLAAMVGILLVMVSKKTRKQDVGTILIGFAVLMFGMELMSDSVSPLSGSAFFTHMLTAFRSPLLGVLIGTVLTMIIQSSAASIGILQALSLTGGITYGMALPIVMGQNIGTCITAILTSFGVNKNAKKVAVVHVLFNVAGTILCMVLFYGFLAISGSTLGEQYASPWGIALSHTIFNVVTTAVMLPCSRLLEKAASLIVRDKGDQMQYTFLDERLLSTPSVAIAECSSLTAKMAHIMRDTVFSAMEQLAAYDPERGEAVYQGEDELDLFEDKLGTSLVKIAGAELGDQDSREVSKLLHSIGDFERIGDHSRNIEEGAREMRDKEICFSTEASAEVAVLTAALREIIDLAVSAFEQSDAAIAKRVEPLEEVIDGLIEQAKLRHIERLRAGKCTIELGFILSDLLNNYERISDHCSNIAVCVIEIGHDSFDTHEYLSSVKLDIAGGTSTVYDDYRKKYVLPE